LFIDLCGSSNEGGTLANFFFPSKYFLHRNHYASIFANSLYSIIDIPSMGRPYVLSVIDYFKAMSFVTHVSSKLRNLNYDKFHIENVHCIPTTFNGDVLFELPPVINFDNHFG